jgi:hypothetical protein
MTEQPMNREQRRHPPKDDGGMEPPDHPQSSESELVKAKVQDVQSVRAKNSGHGKKTADKWNQ